MNTNAENKPVKLEDKQLVHITGYKGNQWFTAGTIEGYTKSSNETAFKHNWPQTDIEEEIKNTLAKGEAIAWLNPNGTALVSNPAYYEHQQKLQAAAPVVPLHSLVEMEGRIYRVEPTWNHNVKLVPIPQ